MVDTLDISDHIGGGGGRIGFLHTGNSYLGCPGCGIPPKGGKM